MTTTPKPASDPGGLTPTSFLAAAAALDTIHEALHTARTPRDGERPESEATSSEQALAALLSLREARDQLAEWEAGLIEAARDAGASWADLAHPLGVSSRQAAERRYLRVRPGRPGSTGEQRVQATRDRRAADRTVTTWARANAADLRGLAGRIAALTDLPAAARTPVVELTAALADDDAAALIAPLADTHTYLAPGHPEIAAQVDDITRHTTNLRRTSTDHRQNRT
ncbi:MULTISPECIES: type III effector protein [unclassified Streptomyces]|uniref:type III effector protein n=1 Tax=unclassified Streptomyces TaxID=2593676 RepID=UPI002E775C49|nr:MULTISPECIES: type III effector protein [unclassified Streptomyces]MEE1764510.1 type III effector protein [Streptomyces sp. SP18BB07]MEE1831180.1 type III effector protein [Streptomyces sp. SP17KL33]